MPPGPSDASSPELVPGSTPRRAGRRAEWAVSPPRPHSGCEVRRPGLLGSRGPGGALPSSRPAAAGRGEGADPRARFSVFPQQPRRRCFVFLGLPGRMSRPRS